MCPNVANANNQPTPQKTFLLENCFSRAALLVLFTKNALLCLIFFNLSNEQRAPLSIEGSIKSCRNWKQCFVCCTYSRKPQPHIPPPRYTKVTKIHTCGKRNSSYYFYLKKLSLPLKTLCRGKKTNPSFVAGPNRRRELRRRDTEEELGVSSRLEVPDSRKNCSI